MYLGRDQILEADDLTYDDVNVPEWGGVVRVRALTGTERDKFEASLAGNGKKMSLENVRAKLVASCIVDAEGQQLFAQSDVTKLGHKSAIALNRVFDVAQRLSGLTDDDVEDLSGN